MVVLSVSKQGFTNCGSLTKRATRVHNRPNYGKSLLMIGLFIHSGHFYSAPSSPLLLRGAPDYSADTVSEFHAEAHRQL